MRISTRRECGSVAEREPLVRSPVAPVAPVVVGGGWEISGRRSAAALRITDCTPLAKVLVRAAAKEETAQALGVPFGRARRDGSEGLVVGSGPGEWLLLGPTGSAARLTQRWSGVGGEEFVSLVDITHGGALLRLSGADAALVLSKVCAIDLDDRVTPNGAAFRSAVAKVVTGVVRDDQNGERSYLLHCDRSVGQYLFDALLDAGGEFGIDVDGFRAPGI